MRIVRRPLLLLLLLAPLAAEAQAPVDSARPGPFISRVELGALVIGAGLAVVAQRSDLKARNEVRSSGYQENGTLDAFAEVGNYWGQPGVMISSSVLWLGGRVTGHPIVSATGLRALEAIVISGSITQLLKAGFGRARPRENPIDAWDVESWRDGPFDGAGDYESFPSGHATAAFAFASAVTSELLHREVPQAKLIGIATYSLAAVTAYARMHVDAHWLSDVTMGAAIGTATGWAVARWHSERPYNNFDAIFLGPSPSGRIVGVRITWR